MNLPHATMQQSRDMKRHATGLRWPTGFLVVMLCLQVLLHVTEAADDQKQAVGQADSQARGQTGVRPQKNNRHAKGTVHLLTARGIDGKVAPLHNDGFYIWMMNHNTRNIFKLEDNSTSLVVPKKGLYIVNLKMYYYIPSGHKCEKKFLITCIQQYHSSYPKWIDIIKGIETMQCVESWYQSVTLSQVVSFKKKTKLRVIIDPKNYDFIIGDVSTYFSVTLL